MTYSAEKTKLARHSASSRADPTPQGRRHAQFYSGIRNGLWEPKHEGKMGKAVWLFGWLVSRQTTQNGSTGLVLGGKVLTWEWVAAESGWPIRTLQRWGEVLRREGYIESTSTQHGFIVRIRNAKKFLHYQGNLFPGTPEVASLARNGGARSGDPDDKGGEPDHLYLSMKHREKSKGGAPHPLHDEIRKWCAGEWDRRFGRKPPWDGRDNRALKELLEARPDMALTEVQQVWANYMASTKKFYDDNGWPLWVFCKDFAGLSLHPVHDRGEQHGARRTGKRNGSGDPDKLARFRVGVKARDFAQRAR